MGDCSEIYGCRPDGGHGPSGWQLCDQNFWDFRRKSFLFESRIRMVRHCRPDGRTSAASNFHIRLHASGPRGMAIQTVNLQHAISISDERVSGWLKLNTQFPYQMHVRPDHADRRPDGCIWIEILALWMSASGRESMSSRRLYQSSLIWTWKESEADRSLDVVRTGCWDVRTDAR
jgi:hypothetical protein